ncbi:unnamed protein product, partial [Staurois parvus]
MTRDCGHSGTQETADIVQRPETVDTVQEMTRDWDIVQLNLTGTYSRFRGVVLPSSFCAGFCDSLVPTAHAREALRFYEWPSAFWDLSCVPEDTGQFT